MLFGRLRRLASIALTVAGNLAILGLPAAHGYAHEELAHHAVASVDAVQVAGAIALEQSEAPHEHPDFSATVAGRAGPLFAALPAAPVSLPSFRAIRTVYSGERRIRLPVRPSQTAPPHLRAPPKV